MEGLARLFGNAVRSSAHGSWSNLHSQRDSRETRDSSYVDAVNSALPFGDMYCF